MHRAPRILVVEDSVDVLNVLKHQLEYHGFDVATALSGPEGLDRLASFWPDVILSDVLMPGMDGFQFARQVKKKTDIPIVFLTVHNDAGDKAVALEELAEDYILKPWEPAELYARLDRVLRHHALQPRAEARLVVDDRLTLDLSRGLAYTPSGIVHLTSAESRLLYCLAQNGGQPIANEELMARLWPGAMSQTVLRNTIAHLRAKLEPDPDEPRYIVNKSRVGYLLALAPDPSSLTEQQVEILRLVAQGQTDNEIAAALGLSSKTISSHVKLIRQALNARSRTHAVVLAIRFGLLKTADIDPGSEPGQQNK